jgi:hypothetical protein
MYNIYTWVVAQNALVTRLVLLLLYFTSQNTTWMVDLETLDPLDPDLILGKMPRITRNGLDLELDWMIGFSGFIMFYDYRNSNPYYYHDGIII